MKPAFMRDNDLLVIGESIIELRCDGAVIDTDVYEKDIRGADLFVYSIIVTQTLCLFVVGFGYFTSIAIWRK